MLNGVFLLIQALVHDIDGRQAQLDCMQRQGDTMCQNLSAPEREKLERRLQDLKEDQKRLKEAAIQKRKDLAKCVKDREGLQDSLHKMDSWLKEKTQICEATRKFPLQTTSLAKQLDEKKASSYNLWNVISSSFDWHVSCSNSSIGYSVWAEGLQ